MRLTVTSHLTLDGVVQSNGKPEPEKTTSRGVVAHIYLPSGSLNTARPPPSKRTGWSGTR